MGKQDLKTPDEVGKRKAELRRSCGVTEVAECVGPFIACRRKS